MPHSLESAERYGRAVRSSGEMDRESARCRLLVGVICGVLPWQDWSRTSALGRTRHDASLRHLHACCRHGASCSARRVRRGIGRCREAIAETLASTQHSRRKMSSRVHTGHHGTYPPRHGTAPSDDATVATAQSAAVCCLCPLSSGRDAPPPVQRCPHLRCRCAASRQARSRRPSGPRSEPAQREVTRGG